MWQMQDNGLQINCIIHINGRNICYLIEHGQVGFTQIQVVFQYKVVVIIFYKLIIKMKVMQLIHFYPVVIMVGMVYG